MSGRGTMGPSGVWASVGDAATARAATEKNRENREPVNIRVVLAAPGCGYGGASTSAYATVLDSTQRGAETLPGGAAGLTMEGRPSRRQAHVVRPSQIETRSEERRVGKEGRSRGAPDH